MPDDRNIRGPEDGKLISIKEDHEVAYWCEEFGVERAELLNAVKHVGVSARAVRIYLQEK